MKTRIRHFALHDAPPLSIATAPLVHTRASAARGELRELRAPEAPGALLLRWLPTVAATVMAVAIMTSTL
jgi:hypothetical protein